MIIAVDAAGGDYAPHEVVKGAIKAAQEYEVGIALVGRRNVLHVLAGRSLRKSGVTIVDAKQVIEPDESPLRAIRDKPNSSIVVGINLLKSGGASSVSITCLASTMVTPDLRRERPTSTWSTFLLPTSAIPTSYSWAAFMAPLTTSWGA